MDSTDAAVLRQLGERLARQRLRMDLTQQQLAYEAGVSPRTVSRLESGESTQLTNLVRILRALELLDDFAAALPSPGPTPLELVRGRGRRRQRASGAGGHPDSPLPWRWGDEEDA